MDGTSGEVETPVAGGQERGGAGAVLVTGSSGGIGEGIARVLGARGWSVTVNYHSNAERAQDVVEAIKASGGDAVAVGADATTREGVGRLVDTTVQRFGRIDAAVGNAHVPFTPSTIENTGWEDLRGKLEGEMAATFHLTRACLGPMRAGGGGAIVLVSSLQALGPAAPGMVANGAAKSAVAAFARYAAWELGRDNVRVSTVASSLVRTAATAHLPEPFVQAVERATPLGRMATPEDVGRAVAFLLGPDGVYTTGVDLSAGGGFGLSLMPGAGVDVPGARTDEGDAR